MVGTVSVTSKHALGLNCAEFHFYKGKWLLGSATQPFTQTTNGAQRGEWRKMETLWQVRNPTASFGGRFCEWIQHWFGTGLILEKSWRTQPGLPSLNLMLMSLPGVPGCWKGAGGACPWGQDASTWADALPQPQPHLAAQRPFRGLWCHQVAVGCKESSTQKTLAPERFAIGARKWNWGFLPS